MKKVKTLSISLVLGDVRFWIILFFVIRLFNIDSPLFDSHSWRQTDGYSIARNFYEIDANILYPRVDHAGNLSGIAGSEFPIMNYIVYWMYLIFGVDWWQGRLLNLIVSSIGCYFFYKIIFNYIKKEIALISTLFLIASLWFSHSRKFMPDVFSSSLVIIAIYFGWRFLKDKQNWNLVFYLGLLGIGLLSKLPAFVLASLLAPAIFDSSISLKRKSVFVLLSFVAILPSVWWYFYWAPKLTIDYGHYAFFMGSDISTSLTFLISEWQNTCSRYYLDAMHYVGFVFYVLGIIYSIFKKEKILIILLIFGFVFQTTFMLKGGETFAHHTYYIISFVPIMAIFASYFISLITLKWVRNGLVAVVIIEGILNLQHDFMPKPSLNYRLKFESLADAYTKNSDLIMVNNEVNPSSLYFAHRKGWTVSNSVVTNNELLKQINQNRCKLFIWDKDRGNVPTKVPYFKFVEETIDFAVFVPE